MGNPIAARKNGKFKAVSTAPSFNKTPMGNSTPPVGYGTYHDLTNSVGTSPNVKFNGDPAYMLDQTVQSNCTGDNPGTAGGVKSGTVNGEIKPTTASKSIRINGKNLVRERDKCTLNKGNCPGIYVTEPETQYGFDGLPIDDSNATPMDTHDVLDALGYIPFLGSVTSVANAGLYAAEGNLVMAVVEAGAVIPGEKLLVKGGKMVYKGGKMVAEKVGKKTKNLAKQEGKQVAGHEVEQEVKQTVKKGDGARIKGTPKDPCKHDKGKKLKKYVVYRAEVKEQPGKYYIGRTSGSPDMNARQILKKRKSGHHRKDIGDLIAIFETDSYSATRGAEQKNKDKMTQNGTAAKQIEPISKRNKKKDDYLDCAKLKGA